MKSIINLFVVFKKALTLKLESGNKTGMVRSNYRNALALKVQGACTGKELMVQLHILSLQSSVNGAHLFFVPYFLRVSG
jgi:hypothetical protein